MTVRSTSYSGLLTSIRKDDIDMFLRTLKRFGRVIFAAAIGAGVQAGLSELQAYPFWFLIGPMVTAFIAALGKFIRDRLGIPVPF